MRTFTFKGLFLTAVFMLLGCLSIQAADDDLITKQITVKLDKAGTLPNKIGSSRKYNITNLKLVGEINGTDLRMIREMAGRDYRRDVTDGNLSVLDLSEAKIVRGGDYYYQTPDWDYYYTYNDEIGSYAFSGCSGLTSLTIPSNITYIGGGAFEGCSGLKSINIPSSITFIGEGTFSGCSGLRSINIPSSVTKIGKYAFQGCSRLTSINLPSSITKIGESAFWDCSLLKSINLPASITEIGKYAFCGCSRLTSINLPASVTKIDEDTFSGCSRLTSINLPASITEINKSAFEYCWSLTSINLPASITYIGWGAFKSCSGLTSIYVYSEKVPKIDGHVFEECDAKKCTVYVPKGTYDDYCLSEFRYFENIVEFDATGIDKTTTSTDVEEVSRYSVNGQRLVGPTKGLNIVKYSDGTVKKVAVE